MGSIIPKIFGGTEKKVTKKIIMCGLKKCSFGLKKIDKQCNLCANQKVIGITGEIEPIFAKVTEEYQFQCYRNPGLPMHKECIFGFKKASFKCVGCARLKPMPLDSKTEIINKF